VSLKLKTRDGVIVISTDAGLLSKAGRETKTYATEMYFVCFSGRKNVDAFSAFMIQ
jgi:hypothetical protein